MDSPTDLRPADPGPPSRGEIDELLAMQQGRDPSQVEIVNAWGSRPAVLPWTELALDMIRAAKPTPVRAARALALVHAAMSDATAAVVDARTAYARPAPATTFAGLTSLVADQEFSYPSEQAAVAGAAATVLTYLFPAESGRFAAAEAEAADSRLWAGVNYRSDIDAGLAIGWEVGRLAVARGKSDGSDAEWDGVMPSGEGVWQPTPPRYIPVPSDPLAGTWRPWVLASGDALRPPPPSAWGSPAWETELAAVREAVANRTPEQAAAAEFWAGGPGTVTPAGLWLEIARDLIERDAVKSADAAAVVAMTSVAMADAFTCCWDAKFAYWTARPITADPGLDVIVVTPPFPSYTSGHSTISAAAATVLGAYFPGDAAELAAMAAEAKDSRLWAGIHFPLDNETGAAGGVAVGELVLASAGG